MLSHRLPSMLLLKTLEEPPSYVIFILATTEVHKIPVTVLSRCQRYDFRRITIDTIAAVCGNLADAEKIQVEEKARAMWPKPQTAPCETR